MPGRSSSIAFRGSRHSGVRVMERVAAGRSETASATRIHDPSFAADELARASTTTTPKLESTRNFVGAFMTYLPIDTDTKMPMRLRGHRLGDGFTIVYRAIRDVSGADGE